jgi:hypothetical protein
MTLKEQIQSEVKQRIQEHLVQRQAKKEELSFSGFLKNISDNILNFAEGLAYTGYQAMFHPIETTKTVLSAGKEIVKEMPSGAIGLAKEMKDIILHPLQTTKEFAEAYKNLKSIPYDEQKKIWKTITEEALKETEKSRRVIGIIGSGLLGETLSEITHPLEYAYENPVSFALDALTLGSGLGMTKSLKSVFSRIPATKTLTTALKELFSPYGKLVSQGYEDVARLLTETKSKMFKLQREIIEETSRKFFKEFALTPQEQKEFFETIDALRRAPKEIKATSSNPKIQKAIDWWLDEEAPKLAQLAGLPEERTITNYLHHLFPEKFKPKELQLTTPLKYAQRGYLKTSKDVEGYIKDPVISISAIKSKVLVDNLKDDLIDTIINRYGLDESQIRDELIKRGINVLSLDEDKIFELGQKYLDLGEFKSVKKTTGEKIRKLLPKPIAEELNKFVRSGKDNVLEKLFYVFDVFNRNWKPLATIIRPRFIARNILGNLYNAIIVGGTHPKEFGIALLNQARNEMAKSIENKTLLGKFYQKIYGKDIPQPEVIKLAIDNDVIGRGFFGADLNALVDAYNAGDDILKVIKNINTPAEIYRIPGLKQLLYLSQKISEFVEDNARLAMFQEGLKRYNGNVLLAKDYVNKHLFDYLTGLGEADKVIRRFIPFWSWTRFNIPLQLQFMVDQPLKYNILMKIMSPFIKAKQLEDKNYEYLTEQQKEAGYIKVGEYTKEGKEFVKYIKTASVLPVSDLARLAQIFQGQDEEIGLSPLLQIYQILFKDPTKLLDYFGHPIEAFNGERTKFLNMSVRGRTKALLSLVPALVELNKAIGGSYFEKEKPDFQIRLEQVFSPFGLSLVDVEKSKFFKELEKEKELKGSYSAGLDSLYKRYLKTYLETKEKTALENVNLLEKELLDRGLTKLDILKLKNQAIKKLIREKIEEKTKRKIEIKR